MKKTTVGKRPSSLYVFLAVAVAVALVVQWRIVSVFHTKYEITGQLERETTIYSPELFKTSNQNKHKEDRSPQYSFETIPSRTWKIYEHPFPCYPPGEDERNALMATTPAHEGILFQRPEKVGSTTFNNVLLRLVHNRAAEKLKTGKVNATLWKTPVRCKHRAMHGMSVGLDYKNRDKKKSFLFSLVRDPTKRIISEYFHFKVTFRPEEPTDENFVKHVLSPRRSNKLLRDLTFVEDLGIRMSTEFEHFFKAYKQQQRRKQGSSRIKTRQLDKALLRNDTIVEPIDYTKVVQDILDDYDFIAVTERMEESLVAMKLLLGLTVEEIVYAKISRSAGSFSNGPAGRPCMYLVPSFLSPSMKDFFYTPHKNDLWIENSKGDALLHKAASLSLDRTINEVFGRQTFDRELAEFKNALAYTQAICSSEPELVLGMCDSGGNSVAHDPNRTTTCYIWGEGCDKECINNRVPSPIPEQVLNGTKKFGE